MTELSKINHQLAKTRTRLIAVSKTKPIEDISRIYDEGQRIFGENKAQEMRDKHASLPKDIEWHFIGHLQRNKVKYIAPFVHLIHSVDSLRLLNEINRQGEKNQRVINCLLQIFVADEETKFGLSKQELFEIIVSKELSNLSFICIKGLMAMATFSNDKNKVQGEFRLAKQIFDDAGELDLPENIQLSELSMGMSADYELALKEGSTMVRIGSAIFGERSK